MHENEQTSKTKHKEYYKELKILEKKNPQKHTRQKLKRTNHVESLAWV